MKSKRSMTLFPVFLTICLALAPGLWAQSRAAQTGCGFYEGATAKVKPAAFVEQVSDNSAVFRDLFHKGSGLDLRRSSFVKAAAGLRRSGLGPESWSQCQANREKNREQRHAPFTFHFCPPLLNQA